MLLIKKISAPLLLFMLNTALTILAAYFSTIINSDNSLLLTLSFLLLTAASIALFILIAKRSDLFQLAGRLTKQDWKTILFGLLFIFISNLLLSAIFPEQTSGNQTMILEDLERALPLMAIVLLSAPIFEEITFRGLIYNGLFGKSTLGLLISTLLFVSLHLVSTEDLSAKTMLSYLIPALVFSYIYKKTERLEGAIIAHFINNLIPLLLAWLVLIVEGSLS